MRALYYLPILAALAGCGSDSSPQIARPEVLWMEWPAEVIVQTPFRTRLVVQWYCGAEGFHAGVGMDQSAVTFTPYYIQRNVMCPLTDQPLGLDVWGALDTAGAVPGLSADYPRTYEMRGAASAYAPELGLANDAFPIRMFGDITVRLPGSALLAWRNAAGRAYVVRDTLGCLRLQPLGVFLQRTFLPIENPADTTQYVPAFVRGYIHDTAAPVCGETKVFHLVTRN